MKRNKNLLQPILYISAGCCAAMTLSAIFFDIRLFYVCALVTACCIGLLVWQIYNMKQDINNFLLRVGQTLTSVQEEELRTFPIPVFICADDGEILWCNPLAQEHILEGESSFGRSIHTILSGVNLPRRCPEDGYEVEYKGRHFAVYTAPMIHGDETLYTVYFFENTKLQRYSREYFESRPSIMIITVDNYEELQQGLQDNERTRIMGQIEYTVGKFISDNGGLMLKAERDRFVAVVEERHLRGIISSRFPILEEVHNLESESRAMQVTLSIGVGRDAPNLPESERLARQALDMALGRGGDQAAVRGTTGYEFFGGVSNGVEKNTKVKTRIVATALAELVNSSDNVIVMGHRLADLDCFGASVGMMRAVRLMGKEAFVAIRKEHNLVGSLYERLVQNGFEGLFLEPEEALQKVTKKTLLIICDTHVKHILESQELFDACKSVVVIDHHRKMVGHIANAVIFYHEPYASSASEMVTELVQYFGERLKLGRLEAEALMSGIMLDTKNFVLKTGVRTFEAAAYLRRMGADTVEVRKLFASTMEAYQRKTRLVADAEVYKGCAVACSNDKYAQDLQVTAAQAADELLNIKGVQASFLIFATESGVSFSARSMGQMNVQLIMEKLGGGGHHTMAGAQIAGISVAEGKKRLMAAIDEFFAENSR